MKTNVQPMPGRNFAISFIMALTPLVVPHDQKGREREKRKGWRRGGGMDRMKMKERDRKRGGERWGGDEKGTKGNSLKDDSKT